MPSPLDRTPSALASPGRRLGAAILDGVFLNIAVFVIVLFTAVAWNVHLALGIMVAISATAAALVGLLWTFAQGASPGKMAVNIHVVHGHGGACSLSYMLLREVLVKQVVFGIVGLFTFYIGWLLAAAWCLWDKDKQCLWDKITTTYVVND